MFETNPLVDTVFGRGLAHVIENARPVRDGLRLGPWLEGIAEREHVAVRADAGIAEQVPGPADALPPLENDKILGRAFVLKVIARRDAGQTGADDQDVEMLALKGCFHRGLACRYAVFLRQASTSF